MSVLPSDMQELREGCRLLMRAYGGQDAVAARFGVRQPKVSELLNSDKLLPLPWIAQMEAATRGLPGHPHVTTALARNVDMIVIARLAATVNVADLPAAVMAISRELGDVSGAIMDGLADGNFCANDIDDADRELGHLEQATANLRAQLNALKRKR